MTISREDQELVDLGLVTALGMDDSDQGSGALMRRLALRVRELANGGPTPAWCPVCGDEVIQPARGRPRVYCGTPCRWAARNARVHP